MDILKQNKKLGFIYMFFLLLIVNCGIGFLLFVSNTYIINIFCKILFVCCNLYILYYLIYLGTIKYKLCDDGIYICSFFNFKKVKILFNDIKAYNISKGKIKGVRLSGISNNNFALGRSVIDKIGTTRMFVTNNKHIIYLKTNEINYGISPINLNEIENKLKNMSIKNSFYEINYKKKNSLYKDKKFLTMFIIISIIIVIMTLNPFMLYLTDKLPKTMPLTYNSSFTPIMYGTNKQFAFNQMIYGVFNMLILFCMYYASYFHAKYDKKSSYVYIYIAFIVAIAFLTIQIKILRIYGGL